MEVAGEIALQMDGWKYMEALGWGGWSSPEYCYRPCDELPPRQEVTKAHLVPIDFLGVNKCMSM